MPVQFAPPLAVSAGVLPAAEVPGDSPARRDTEVCIDAIDRESVGARDVDH